MGGYRKKEVWRAKQERNAKRQAGQLWPQLHIFCRMNLQNIACWGASPNPATSGQHGPKWVRCTCCCVMLLSLHFLVFLRVRQAKQMVNIGLCREKLLHTLNVHLVQLGGILCNVIAHILFWYTLIPHRIREFAVFLIHVVHMTLKSKISFITHTL